MPRFLDTRGNSSLAIAICDRCSFKFPIGKLSADRDAPGLRVCEQCNDEEDPYKLPSRKTESITVRYPRPDQPVRPAEEVAPPPPPPPPVFGFHDAFDGIADTLLSDHTPDIASPSFLWGDDGSTPVPVLNGLGSIVSEDSDLFDENISIGAPIELYAAGYVATMVTTCTLLDIGGSGGNAIFTISNDDSSIFVDFGLACQTNVDPAFVLVRGVDGTLTPFDTGAMPVADLVEGEPHEVQLVVTATQLELFYDTVFVTTVVVPGLNIVDGKITVLISVNRFLPSNARCKMCSLQRLLRLSFTTRSMG
jgi:hypothetical protein